MVAAPHHPAGPRIHIQHVTACLVHKRVAQVGGGSHRDLTAKVRSPSSLRGTWSLRIALNPIVVPSVAVTMRGPLRPDQNCRTAEAGMRRKASRAAARLTSRPSGTGVVEAHTSVPRSSEPVGDHGQVPLERHSGRPRPICALISARQCHLKQFAVHFRVRVLPLIRRQGTSSESTVPRAESCSRAGNDAIGGS